MGRHLPLLATGTGSALTLSPRPLSVSEPRQVSIPLQVKSTRHCLLRPPVSFQLVQGFPWKLGLRWPHLLGGILGAQSVRLNIVLNARRCEFTL